MPLVPRSDRRVQFIPNASDLIFQILDIDSTDWIPTIEDPEEFTNTIEDEEFQVRLYGVNAKGHSVVCTLTGFKPYFYVEIPSSWGHSMTDNLVNQVVRGMGFVSRQFDKSEIVHRKRFYGFAAEQEFPFLKLYFQTERARKRAINLFRDTLTKEGITRPAEIQLPGRKKYQLYESNMEPMIKLIHEQDLSASGWCILKKGEYQTDPDTETTSNITVKTHYTRVHRVDRPEIGPYLMASFDIECVSEDGSFPIATRPGDHIIQIGTVFWKYSDPEPCMKHILCLKGCDPIEGATVEVYQEEAELLAAWTRLIARMDPDILVGYNIFGFDLEYIKNRAMLLRVWDSRVSLIGRFKNESCLYKEKTMSSSAYGENIFKMIEMTGRVVFDLYKSIQREYKLESYKLDSVAEHFLGMNKHDISPKQIFQYYRETDEKRRIIAEYCIQDCVLVVQLVRKLDILTNNIGLSNVCSVPLRYIFLRGQGIKCYSLVGKESAKIGYVIQTYEKASESDESGYQGAICMDAMAGLYYDPISCNDFASLYPSSMISHNLSPDTLVVGSEFDNLPGIQYRDIKWEDEYGNHHHRFAQIEGKKGIVPMILENLLKVRKQTRKLAEAEPDPFRKSVLDGLQLAYKVTANSIYGQTGAPTSSIYCIQVASSTTAVGRELITIAKNKACELFPGTQVVYGDTDSCFFKFPIPDNLTGPDRIAESIRCSHVVEQEVNKILPRPHNFEYDKSYCPLLLIAKKRYVGLLYESDPTKSKLDYKGIVLKRRDNAPIVKHIYGEVIRKILYESDPESVKSYVREEVQKVLMGEYPIEYFIITKSLKSGYANPGSIPQKVLADKMMARDPGIVIMPGDRVPYVIRETKEKKKKVSKSTKIDTTSGMGKYLDTRVGQSIDQTTETDLLQADLAEDPVYLVQNGLKIDYQYYITNQLQKPLTQDVLGVIMERPEELFDPALREYRNKRQGLQSITNFFKN